MTYIEILNKIEEKAKAAEVLLDSDNPNVEEANKLLAEVKSLRELADAAKGAEEAKSQAKAALDALRNEPPVNPGLQQVKVVKDEADKKVEAGPSYKSLGNFLLDIAALERDDNQEARTRLRGLRDDEDGFNIGKAIGQSAIGSLYQASMIARARKAISGMSELVPQDGGLLAQTDVRMDIISRMYNVGQLLQRINVIPISANSNSLTLYGENETSRVDGSRRGGIQGYWASEGDEKTSSKPAFREINFKLQKLIGLVYATDELMQDAAALEAWIMQMMPEELTFKAEDAIINGTGVGMPQGIIGAGCTVSVAKETGQTADTVVAENIIKMWARRWARKQDYVWLCNQDVTPQLHQMNLPVGTGGALVYMPPGGLSQSPYGTLYGRPVIEIEYCPTVGDQGDIILASLSEYQAIDKGGVQSAVSIHVRFIYDEQVFRFVYRIDGKPLWHSALTPYKGTNTQSPFVVLAARA